MADGDGGPDLEIRFTPVADVTVADLVEAWPAPTSGALVVDGIARPGDLPLAACGLAHGATVSVGPPPPPDPGALHVVAGPMSPRSLPLEAAVLVGRGVACDLRLDDPSVAPAHVLVEPGAGGWMASAVAVDHATLLDGEPLGRPMPFRPSSVLSVGAVDLQVVLDTSVAPVSLPQGPVHRAVVPSTAIPAAPDPLPEPAPPSPPPSPPGLLSLTVPIVLGAVLAVTVHPAAGLITAVSPLLAVGAHLDGRRRHRREGRRADAVRAEAIEDHARERAAHDRTSATGERSRFPTPVEAIARARGGVGLWPVRVGDHDAQQVAVGWIDDATRRPAIVDLDGDRRLGVAGPGPWADAVARALIIQATARAGPTAWHLIVPEGPGWRFARWLPHRHGSGRTLAVGGGDAGAGLEVADRRTQLTDRCAAVVEWAPDGAVLWDGTSGGIRRPVRPFLAPADLSEAYGRASARWTDPDPTEVALPDHVSLRALLAGREPTVEDGRRRLVAPLGVGRDGVLTVDLVADGPHALVAGTTGAGKSELLRTWVTALALRHPPTAVAFVLVDYKGGSAFDACARLPHVTGVVTDLDAGLGERLLIGLRAEVREREAVLRAAGVGDLRDLAEGPPRLIVVVDEFATLAAELPDFLGALVDVARRGRSLGVHLVLATQRPAGAVSDDIRANTALRVCLRTLDAADSQDVIGGPEAARLPADRPGRAWFRHGPGLQLLQVACAAGPVPSATGSVAVRRVGSPWPDELDGAADRPTELDRLVAGISATWADRPRPAPSWLPPLPDHLALDDGPPVQGDPPRVALGRIDRPADRTQPPLLWSPTTGPLVVLGGRGAGRTTAVRTAVLALAEARSASTLHVQVVTRDGDLDDLVRLPHVGAVVPAHDRATVGRMIGRVATRRECRGPLTAVVIDGYEALAAALDDLDGLRLLEGIDELAREGARRDVALVVTSSRPMRLPPSLLGAADLVVALRLDDPADYGLLGLRPPSRTPPPGRGWCGSGHEVQLGRVTTSVAAIVAAHGPLDPMSGPRPVGPLPRRMTVAELDAGGSGVALGRRDRDLATAFVRLPVGTAFVISGPPRSGRTTAFARLLAAADRPVTTYRAGDHAEPFTDEVGAWLDDPSPRLFAVDGAEALADPRGVLRDLATRRHPDAQILVSVRADVWRTAYGSWLAALRPASHGLALAPDPGQDADAWSVALPAVGPDPPPGRGVLVGDGDAAVIQVAVPDG